MLQLRLAGHPEGEFGRVPPRHVGGVKPATLPKARRVVGAASAELEVLVPP